ncbi:MAG: hypothetical protein HZA90_07650 [Verrucomicrobia bacterium]|nr:hypothetical protein [Verrucomicrobiota bacterium]
MKPERIVLQHVSRPRFQLTATFAEEAGKTRLTWWLLFDSAEECAKIKPFAAEANKPGLDRLKPQLTNMTTTERPFVIPRGFDAPRELVWKAWTERDRLMPWWGSKGGRARWTGLPITWRRCKGNQAFH